MNARGPTMRDLIELGARAHGSRIAVIAEGQAYTFSQVNARANRLARALARAGAGKGARVAVLLNNGPESVPVDFACAKGGVNKVPLNSRLSRDEHVRMVHEAGCGFLLFGADLAGRAAELAAAIPELVCLGLHAKLPGGADLAVLAESEEASAPDVMVDHDDVVLTLYTSGTTGVLKAARHTQASWAAICRNVLLNLFPVGPDDRMLHAASLIHASGTFVLPLWLRGGCSVVLPGFAPDAFLSAIEQHRVTAINLVPTMLQMLLDSPGLSNRNLSSLRHIVYGASPMPRRLIERAMAAIGRERFWQYYGQTEVPLCIAVLRPEDHFGDRLGACGRPSIDLEVKLIGDQGHDAGNGPGEIVVRSASAAAGYFNAPELSEQTFDAEGWVHTRDIGRFDADGFLYLLDRTSDMIITGGYNVYPREVEDALLSHDAVSEAAVVGAPDEKWVEAVTAFVVLGSGASATGEELIAHVAARLASYKKPHRVMIVAELPKTAVGKIDRKALRAGSRGT